MTRVPLWAAVAICCVGQAALAQDPGEPTMTLAQAREIALVQRPSLKAKQFSAATAREITHQYEAARYPQLAGNLTAVAAERDTVVQDGKEVNLDTRIAAGALNNPTVLRRDAAGVVVSQLITDFGRTSNLVESSRFNEVSQMQQLAAIRSQVMLDVDEAYFGVLEAQAVLRVARKTVDARKLLLDRVAVLTRSKLKSELEVKFAEVSLDEARLLLLRAENAVEGAFARLSTSLGYRDARRYRLTDPTVGDAPPAELEAVMGQALARRPELESLRADHEAAQKLAAAQDSLRYPSISAFAAAGVVPVGDSRFPSNYGAIGVNLNLTLFDGGKISALRQEAKLKTYTASENLSEAENTVASAVRIAWLNAKAGYENITITRHLQDVSSQALKLAESRYALGITSIVELNQAQLSAIDAEIGYSRAKYRYLLARAVLDYQSGAL
ncbi:MAG: TolC family protein [Betaproteobacteria bacterium]